MKDKDHPCYQCPDRVLGCHGTCERYKAVTEEQKEHRTQIIKGRKQNSIGVQYSITKSERLKKRK